MTVVECANQKPINLQNAKRRPHFFTIISSENTFINGKKVLYVGGGVERRFDLLRSVSDQYLTRHSRNGCVFSCNAIGDGNSICTVSNSAKCARYEPHQVESPSAESPELSVRLPVLSSPS